MSGLLQKTYGWSKTQSFYSQHLPDQQSFHQTKRWLQVLGRTVEIIQPTGRKRHSKRSIRNAFLPKNTFNAVWCCSDRHSLRSNHRTRRNVWMVQGSAKISKTALRPGKHQIWNEQIISRCFETYAREGSRSWGGVTQYSLLYDWKDHRTLQTKSEDIA